MAQKTLEVRNGTVVVEVVKRPVVRGSVCYQEKMYDLKKEGEVYYIDLYNMDDYPDGPVSDPELERLIGWFCQNRKEIAQTYGAEKIYVDDEEGVYFVKRSSSTGRLVWASLMALVGMGGNDGTERSASDGLSALATTRPGFAQPPLD